MRTRNERIRYETRAKILKSLAHPARLRLIDQLSDQAEVCVCDLTEVIGSDMSTVSRHLAQLKQAGIVESEKRGQMVYYRLRVKCLKGLFACIESVVKSNADENLIVLS
ncbi:MAG: metalloregulator ArsR/SmtB family transcription factor [Pirellulales bacterium]